MPRVKGGYVTRRRRKRTLKLAKGYFGSKHILYKTAHEQVMKSLAYAYRDRKQRKRDFRKLWITRINAACRMQDLSYSRFMHGLKLASVDVNRKMLADLAVKDLAGFNQLVELAKDALANPDKFESKTVIKVKEIKKEKKTKTKKETKKTETKKAEPKKETKKTETKKVEPKKETKKAEPKKAEPKKETKKAEPKKEEGPQTAAELKKLTVKDLRALAKERNVSIPSGSRKADIVELLATK